MTSTRDRLAEECVMRINGISRDEVGEYATDLEIFKAGYSARDEQVGKLIDACKRLMKMSNFTIKFDPAVKQEDSLFAIVDEIELCVDELEKTDDPR